MTVHSVNSVKSLMFIIFSVAEYKYQIRLILDKINRNLAVVVVVAFCYFEYTLHNGWLTYHMVTNRNQLKP